jgi:hypothetical protein
VRGGRGSVTRDLRLLDRQEEHVGNGLRTQARRVLLQQVAPAYHRALGAQKQQILEEFVTCNGYLGHPFKTCPSRMRRILQGL